MVRTVAFLAFALLLSACTQEEFNSLGEMLASDADLRRAVHSECIEEVSRQPRKQRERGAKVMNVTLTYMPSTFCRRIVEAWVSGRLKYADLEAARRKKTTDNVLRILRGRS